MTAPAGSVEDSAVFAHTRASYVLVADADIIRSASLIESLGRLRKGALVARDGVEAIEILRRFGLPKLLVISLSLPRRDPFAVISALRGVAGPERTAIIALASIADIHRIAPAVRRSMGISAVLPYAVGDGSLRAAIEKAFDETRTAAGDVLSPAASSSPRDVSRAILHDVTSRPTVLAGAARSAQLEQLKTLSRDFGLVLSRSSRSVPTASRPRDEADNAPPVAAETTIDPVTGLAAGASSRAVVMQQTTLARVRRQPIGLILIAPDGVEDPGDPVVPPGRHFRDRVLRRLRNAAMGSLRSSDVAVRWGPAEILVLLPAVGIVMARHVAERLREAVGKNRARDLPALTVSGGVTEVPSGSNPEAAIRRVRERLAEARKRGGNRIY